MRDDSSAAGAPDAPHRGALGVSRRGRVPRPSRLAAMSFAGRRTRGASARDGAREAARRGEASRHDPSSAVALTRYDVDMTSAMSVSNPRTGATVAQRRRWDPDELLDGVRERTAYAPDDAESEWMSEWGEAPAGAHESDRPGWRGGGVAPNRRRVASARVERPRPVAVVPAGTSPSVGVAGLESKLRRWLIAHRALHEPKRVTLIRMLGAGLVPPADDDDENENAPARDRDAYYSKKTVNGLPTDANGRPIGVVARYPSPKYAAVDLEGNPLPPDERARFIPRSLPPSKRSYHPLSAPPGPKNRDGTWDSPKDAPREMGDPEVLDKERYRAAPRAYLTPSQFATAMRLAGVDVSDQDVAELFEKHAVRGIVRGRAVLELEAFADKMLAAPQRDLGAPATPLDPEGPERPEAFAGKIVYAPCRTGVFAPSDWDGRLARVSATPPNADLELEWAHGASVAGTGGILAAAAKPKPAPRRNRRRRGEADDNREDSHGHHDDDHDGSESSSESSDPGTYWVYALGALGVVYDAARDAQHFFRGHDDEILSLAVHPSGRWAATGQAGRAPCAVVWETATGKEVARLRHPPGDVGVIAVAFGPGDGDASPGSVPARLVTVASDAKHTVRVWDWGGKLARRGASAKIHEAIGYSGGAPPQIRGVAWSPDADRFATFGSKHVKLWTPRDADADATGARPQGGAAAAAAEAARRRAAAAAAAAAARGIAAHPGYAPRLCVRDDLDRDGTRAETADALCGAFVPGFDGELLVTGHADGTMLAWRGRRLERVVDAGDGKPLRALTAVARRDGTREIITGASGGTIRRWVVDDEGGVTPAGAPVAIPREAPGGWRAPPPNVRAVAAREGDVVAVTAAGDLWSVGRDADAAADEASGAKTSESESESFAFASRSPRALIRGQSSAAHSVAWHPTSREGIFAVAAGAARVVIRSAASRRALGAAWLVDPFPARAVAVAFSSVPAPESFPEEADTEDAGGMLLAAGTADGDVRLFRLTRRRHRVEGEGEGRGDEGVGDRDRDGREPDDDGDETVSARCVACVKSCDGPITALVFSPDGARLAAGSEDRAVSVHVVSRPGEDGEVRWLPSRVRCKGHAAAIVAVDWSPDSTTLRTSSRAHEILHFDARTGRQAIGDFRDAEWREWTSPVGFQAMGVFQDGGLAGNEVNTACRAGARRLLAAGDDFGRVRLLRWPCVAPNAPAAEQTEAHANHVACVRFSPDEGGNAWLVSTGGKDRGALQWRVVGGGAEDDEAIATAAAAAAAASQAAIVDGIVPAEDADEYEYEEEEEEVYGDGDEDGEYAGAGVASSDVGGSSSSTAAALLRRRTGSSRTLAYRKTRLAELDAKMSALLSTARPAPPPRRERPWARRPSVPPRGRRGEGTATPEPKPPTPEPEGERLEYVDGEYRWTDAPRTDERGRDALRREGA